MVHFLDPNANLDNFRASPVYKSLIITDENLGINIKQTMQMLTLEYL